MTRFEQAEKRMLQKKICMRCNARNPQNAKFCRKCGYTGLRVRRKERQAAG